jgi:hypothetical protein
MDRALGVCRKAARAARDPDTLSNSFESIRTSVETSSRIETRRRLRRESYSHGRPRCRICRLHLLIGAHLAKMFRFS